MSDPLWVPDAARKSASNLAEYMRWLNGSGRSSAVDYPDLYRWSVESPADFWKSLWDYFSPLHHHPYETVLADPKKMPGARWFTGSTLNFAENLLRYRDDRIALVSWLEKGRRQQLSYAELYGQVARLAHYLREKGIGMGDRVAGFMPNVAETVVAMLATTSLGALWSSCSPDFGVQGVLDRFGQIAPTVLFAADGYYYSGKAISCIDRLATIVESLPSQPHLVVVPILEADPAIHRLAHATLWTDALNNAADSIDFVPTPFDHPLYIMYSSGTTGAPKCIVHGVGGTLLQHLKEHALHMNLGRQDVLFFYTTCGWMMWNWLVSGLALGATLVLYDGSPLAPRPAILWDIAEKERISIFGTSAKYLAAQEKVGVRPAVSHNLPDLKAVLSTGSPLAHESFDYVYRDIKADICLSSISGGTDIISCFALGCPVLPVYRGELQCRGLGMDVDIVDDDGTSLRGQKGELVCKTPFPSMPLGFWNDPDGQKYHDAYFSRFPGWWAHGDYAELTESAGVIIHGRSDAVLNPGGVRIGTAEIYRQVDKVPEVLESIAIGQDWQGDVRVVLFVRLREGVVLDETLIRTICQTIRKHTTPRHVPAKVVAVPDIPKTISGKLVELAVRNAVHGLPVKNTDALANPEALDHFRSRPELAS